MAARAGAEVDGVVEDLVEVDLAEGDSAVVAALGVSVVARLAAAALAAVGEEKLWLKVLRCTRN